MTMTVTSITDAKQRARDQAWDMAPEGMDLLHVWEMSDRALALMEENGLRPGEPDGWSFRWDNAWQRAGNCDYIKKELSFSFKLFSKWSVEHCLNTIFHEIAHALVRDNRTHSRAWQLKAIQLGGNGAVRWGGYGEERVAEVRRQTPRFEGFCPNHHHYTRVRLPKRKVSCGQCSRSYDERYLIEWRNI